MRLQLAFVVLMLSGVGICLAQESRATLLGRVTDSSNAVVPKVAISVTNQATGVTFKTATNDQGNYVLPFLNPAAYRISAEAKGFKHFVREGVELQVGDRTELNITLEVGSFTETVTVTGEGPLLDTAGAVTGQVIDARRVQDLPVPWGVAYHLIVLAPGAAYAYSGGHTEDEPYLNTDNVGYAINGAKAFTSVVTLDGAPNVTTYLGNQITAAFSPPADIVSEFKVQTGAFDASIGQTQGGAINVSLKSGTNGLHGTFYNANMNPVFGANNFFSNRAGLPKSNQKSNRWGLSATGPIVFPKIYNGRNRTFFTYAYEALREMKPRGSVLTVPTAKERTGDFSDLLALGSKYQIYDPATRRAIAGGRYQVDPLPGNILPASRISPIATNILKYYSMPNVPGTVDGLNNLDRSADMENAHYYAHIARVDQYIGSKDRMFFRVNAYKRTSFYNNWFRDAATGEFFIGSSPLGAQWDNVYTFNATTVLDTRYSFTQAIRAYHGLGDNIGFDLTTLGFPASWKNLVPAGDMMFPAITIGAYSPTYNSGEYQPKDYHIFAATLNKFIGAHNVRTGMEFRAYQKADNLTNNTATGELDFGTTWTRGPLDNSAAAPIGQDLASMLLGLPTGGNITRFDSYAEQSTVWGFFVQDDWKVSPRLSVSLGLRWEFEGPLTERYNRSVRGFDPTAAQPIAAQVIANYATSPTAEVPASQFKVAGGINYAGVNGPRTLYNTKKDNFMPRVSVAYSLNGKTVLRAGYGWFFSTLGQIRGDVFQTGFSQATSLVPSLDSGLTFAATVNNPFPNGVIAPSGSKLGAQTYLGNSVSFFNPNPLNAYMQRWQFSIQRELPGKILGEVTYVGNRGTHIEISRNLDALPDKYLSTSPVRDQTTINYLGTNVSNPFYPLLPGTGLSGQQVARTQLLLPYPQFTGVTTTNYDGYSWYHSLQTRFERRFAQGFTVQGSFTWSKLMEATSYLNAADPSPAKAISDQDFPKVWTFTGVYELPFGKGKRLLGNSNRAVQAIAGNWQAEVFFNWQEMWPLGFGDMLYYGNLKDIPRSDRNINQWFNTAGFERNSSNALASNLVTASVRFPSIRTDAYNIWNLAASKDWKLGGERKKVQLRADFLNAFNHACFAAPNTNQYSTAFGTVTATEGFARRIQIQLKFFY